MSILMQTNQSIQEFWKRQMKMVNQDIYLQKNNQTIIAKITFTIK